MKFVEVPDPHYICPDATLAYGVTSIKADLIDIYPEGTAGIPAGSGFAHGHVLITDPLGIVAADEASFNWIERTGEASNAVITVEGMRISAAKLTIRPGVWMLDGIRAGLEGKHSLGYILAAHATIRPGIGLTVLSADGHLLGTRIGGMRKAEYTIGGHFGGDRLPVPTYDGNQGFGIRYRPLYLADDRTAIAAQASINQFAPPSYGLQLARSFLAAGEAHGLVVPRSELDMRFAYGYFDNIGIESPSDEHEQIGHQRDNLSVDTEYNVQAFDRKGQEVFAKPLEATFERALDVKGFAFLTDSTVQQIHSLGGSDHDRFINNSTVALPMVRISPNLTARLRFDGATFQSASSSFSWLQGQLGLIYRPNSSTRFGAAWTGGRQYGVSLYQADQLYSVNSIDVRGDFDFGPHRLSLLGKFDTNRHRWYDREILVGQQIGPVEIFARYRTFPGQFVFGGMVKLDSLLNEVVKRNPGRPTAPPVLPD